MDHPQRGKRPNRRRSSNKPRQQPQQHYAGSQRLEDALFTEPQRIKLAQLGEFAFSRTCQLPISTRGIGFTISRVTSMLRQRFGPGSKDIPVAAIYRASLAQLMAKMGKFPKRPMSEITRERHDNLSQVALIIDSIGEVEVNGKNFKAVFSEETNALNIRLDNLREYCEKMSKLETDSSERIQGYELNSIPNAKWKRIDENDEKSIVLTNPDEIIPPDYDWNNVHTVVKDLDVVSDWLYELHVREYNIKELRATINEGKKGDPGMLVSTHVIPGQSLKLDNEVISGSQSEFWSLERISHASWRVGVFGLVGETLNPIVGNSRSNIGPMRAVVDWHQISGMTV